MNHFRRPPYRRKVSKHNKLRHWGTILFLSRGGVVIPNKEEKLLFNFIKVCHAMKIESKFAVGASPVVFVNDNLIGKVQFLFLPHPLSFKTVLPRVLLTCEAWLLSRKSKMASLSEQLRDLVNPEPTSFDPEGDNFDLTRAKLDDALTHVDGVYDSFPERRSDLRKRIEPLLEEQDSKYAGEKVSRASLAEARGDDFEESEGEASEDQSEQGWFSRAVTDYPHPTREGNLYDHRLLFIPAYAVDENHRKTRSIETKMSISSLIGTSQ